MLKLLEELELVVMRTNLDLHQFIKENKTKKDFDMDDLHVGGVMSLSYFLLPEVRRQVEVVKDWLKGQDEMHEVKVELDVEEDPAYQCPNPNNDQDSTETEGSICGEDNEDKDKDPDKDVQKDRSLPTKRQGKGRKRKRSYRNENERPATALSLSFPGSSSGSVTPKNSYWYEHDAATKTIKKELNLMLKEVKERSTNEDHFIELIGKAVQLFMDVVIDNPRVPLPVAAQVIVTTLAITLVSDFNRKPIREIMENILFVPMPDLNMEVARKRDEIKTRRKCELQIFLQFEMNRTVPSSRLNADEVFANEVAKLVTLMHIYLKNVNIEKLISEFLMPLYPSQRNQILNFMKAISRDTSILDSLDISDDESSSGPEDSTSKHANDNLNDK